MSDYKLLQRTMRNTRLNAEIKAAVMLERERCLQLVDGRIAKLESITVDPKQKLQWDRLHSAMENLKTVRNWIGGGMNPSRYANENPGLLMTVASEDHDLDATKADIIIKGGVELLVVERGTGRPITTMRKHGRRQLLPCDCNGLIHSFQSPYLHHVCQICRNEYVTHPDGGWARVVVVKKDPGADRREELD